MSDFGLFEKFIKEYNLNNELYCFCDQYHSGHAMFYCTDFQEGQDLIAKFRTSLNQNPDESNFTSFGKKTDIYKFLANFHTKPAAEAFANYLKTLECEDFKGFDKIIRNSVIYYGMNSEIGYEISKKFENAYIDKIIAKPEVEPLDNKIHPISDDDKVYGIKETLVQSNDGTTLNKIFSIFKGNASN
jgi:hypothetical protein